MQNFSLYFNITFIILTPVIVTAMLTDYNLIRNVLARRVARQCSEDENPA